MERATMLVDNDDRWPHAEFRIDLNSMTCKHCGQRLKRPRLPRPTGRGNWGYGRRGSQRGAMTSSMARHLRAKHPEHAEPAATPM